MGLISPLIGLLLDRFGTRILLICGTLTVGLGLILLSFTQSLTMFYCSFLLISFGAGGCTSLVTITAVVNWFHKKLGLALGVMMAGNGFGGLLVPLMIFLIDVYGWRNTLVIIGLGTWTLGIPTAFIVLNKPEQYGYHPDGEPPTDVATNAVIKNDAASISLRKALRLKSFKYLCFVEFIRHMVVTALITHIMPYLTNKGMPRMPAGFVAASIPMLSIVGRLGFGWLSDLYNKKYTMATAFFLMGIGMLSLYYAQRNCMVLLFLILFSPGFGGSMVLRGTVLRESFGRDSFGKLMGITMGFASIGGLIGPTMAGWVFDTIGNYSFIWLFFCGLIGLAMILIMKLNQNLLE